MKIRTWALALLILAAMSVSGCGEKQEEVTEVVAGSYSQELAALFPDREGVEWVYYGTAEYGHHMTLDKIYEANSQKVLKVTGEVEDMSDGESQLDYSLEVTYAIESDRVIQTKLSDVMMDSEYDHLTLIMAPLKLGTQWKEETIDSQGKKTEVRGEIIAIEESSEGTIYKVLYSESKSDYSEVRKLQVGKGVIDMVKTLKYEDQSLELSYHLYRMTAPEGQSEPAAEANTSDVNQVKGTIFKFDELWIDFVNQGDTGLMAYVAKGSPVEAMILNYARSSVKQKYLSIEIEDVQISGTQAQAEVYEKIQETRDDQVQIFEYRWRYHLEKVGDQWYVYSYDEVKNQ